MHKKQNRQENDLSSEKDEAYELNSNDILSNEDVNEIASSSDENNDNNSEVLDEEHSNAGIAASGVVLGSVKEKDSLSENSSLDRLKGVREL